MYAQAYYMCIIHPSIPLSIHRLLLMYLSNPFMYLSSIIYLQPINLLDLYIYLSNCIYIIYLLSINHFYVSIYLSSFYCLPILYLLISFLVVLISLLPKLLWHIRLHSQPLWLPLLHIKNPVEWKKLLDSHLTLTNLHPWQRS